MNKKINLTIIVPVYNTEKYLNECIESIIASYETGIEVLIINDGSTDNSGHICEEFAKKYNYIKVFHRKNGGLSAARNTGINLANGKYIWFVDSDDYIEIDSVKSILKKVEEDKDIIISNYRNVRPNGESFCLNEFIEDYDLSTVPYKYVEDLGNVSYAAPRFIVKRSLVLGNKVFFKEGIYHEDEDWTPRILCEAKTFTTIIPVIYNYRIGNPNSIIGMLNYKKVLDKIIISKDIYDRILYNNYSEGMNNFLKTRIVNNYTAALNEYVLYKGNERKIIKEKLKQNKYLLDNIKTKKAIMVRTMLNFGGILVTSKLLNIRNMLINN